MGPLLWLHIRERHEHEDTHEVLESAHSHRHEVLKVPILKHQRHRMLANGACSGHDQVLTNGCVRLSGLSAAGRLVLVAI